MTLALFGAKIGGSGKGADRKHELFIWTPTGQFEPILSPFTALTSAINPIRRQRFKIIWKKHKWDVTVELCDVCQYVTRIL